MLCKVERRFYIFLLLFFLFLTMAWTREDADKEIYWRNWFVFMTIALLPFYMLGGALYRHSSDITRYQPAVFKVSGFTSDGLGLIVNVTGTTSPFNRTCIVRSSTGAHYSFGSILPGMVASDPSSPPTVDECIQGSPNWTALRMATVTWYVECAILGAIQCGFLWMAFRNRCRKECGES